MDETHRILWQQHELMSYALIFVVFLGLIAMSALAWQIWLTRDLAREGRELQKELREDSRKFFEQWKRDSERLGYYLFTKLGPADTK